MPLPPQKVVLTVSDNKKQLIDIICNELIENKSFHQGFTQNSKLVITGSNNTPIEIKHGVVIQREDMSTSHEEADCIIVQQAIMAATEHQQAVSVVADDNDVFILLMHHYFEQQLTSYMIMESPIHGRSVIDIRGTVRKDEKTSNDLLACHAISGCDSCLLFWDRQGQSPKCDINASLID